MRVEVFTAASVFRDLQAEWLRLLSQMPFQSVFFTPQWQSIWWHHFGSGHQLHVLTVRSDDGELQGLAPLMFDHSIAAAPRLALIGDLELCDYLDLLIAPAWQHEVGQTLAHYLVSQVGEDTELCLTNLARRSLTPALLHDRLAAQGLAVEIDQVETCPTIALPDDWDAYLATLRGKDRHEMRRKIRRAMADAQLEYVVSSDMAELDEHLETFFVLHRMSRQHAKRNFMTAEKTAFFRDMVYQLWSQGWLEVAVLCADKVPVAALCCFTYGTTYAAYNASYHPDYGHLSVGIVLFANRIQSAIDRRFACFDFLRGDEDYKYRFGATDRPLYQLLARAACPLPEACR